MKINGVWFEESSLRKDIVGAFQALLSDPGEWRENNKGLIFSRISILEATILELPFTTEEVLSSKQIKKGYGKVG